MLRQHPWRVVAIVIGALIVAAIVGIAIEGMRLDKNLGAAVTDATTLKQAAQDGDNATVTSSLASLQHHAASAHNAAHSPFWAIVTILPGFGDDAKGVKAVTDVVDGLSHGGLVPLSSQVTHLRDLLPSGGAVNLTTLNGLVDPVDAGKESFDEARATLASHDPSHFVEKLKLKYRELQDDITTADDALASAQTALQILPTMLGADSTQRIMLVLQNNAEIRATGGLPGAVSIITAKNGHIAMTQQVAGAAFGEASAPALKLTEDEEFLWNDKMGTYFLNANFTPDFSRTADLWRARWRQVYPDVNAVVSMDPVTLSYVLGVIGPIKVDGKEINSDNAVNMLLHQVYIDHADDPDAQDAFFRDVAGTVFSKVTSGTGSPQDLLRALSRAVNEHRIYVHSFTTGAQDILDTTPLAGLFPTKESTRPQTSVTLDDGIGSKMSYYLRYKVSVDATSCVGGVQTLSATMTVTNTAPKNAASTLPTYITGDGGPDSNFVPRGDQSVMIDAFGPILGTIDWKSFTLNDVAMTNALPSTLDARPVVQFWANLKPGETATYSWQMTSGKGQTGATDVWVTPSIVPGSTSSVAPTACH